MSLSTSENNPGGNKFLYEPLAPEQIRIVKLVRNSNKEPPYDQVDGIYCVLQAVDAPFPDYSALSYEWGDTSQQFNIQVHDSIQETRRGSIGITRNLRNALIDLMRSSVDPKFFWVDQLCIDQDNPEEKVVQIPQMGSLYRTATRVLTYLGPAESADIEAIQMIDQISRHYNPLLEPLTQNSFGLNTSTYAELVRLLAKSPEKVFPVDSTSSAWAALCRLLCRGWLKRRWMVQENLSNPETFFLRGEHIFIQADGILIIHLIQAFILPMPPASDEESRLTIRNFAAIIGGLGWYKIKPMTMERILWWFSPTLCSDPRDRIFALFGVASDRSTLNITVSYKGTEIDVLVETATRMVEGTKKLRVLLNTFRHPANLEGLPSWVPDWDAQLPTHPSTINNEPSLRASRDSLARPTFSDGGHTLNIVGLSLGTLKGCLGTWHSRFLWGSYRLSFRGVDTDSVEEKLKVLDDICEYCAQNGIDELMVARTLVASTHWPATNQNSPDDMPKRAFRSLMRLLKQSLVDDHVSDQPTENHLQALISADNYLPAGMATAERDLALSFARDVFIRQRSFWTVVDNQSICLAPDTAQVDDLVVVLLGGNLVYVLRPTGEKGKYRFIGTAYIQGFMEGQALENPLWEGKLETFSLL